MSRPRTPFGNDLPGRLPATMLRVLAAEMSDAARLSRGKRYWSDRAVIDLHVGPGVATAEVQGSRRAPYVAVLRVTGGSGAPSRREVEVACSCPDDDGTGIHACKHVVAAIFALADEVSIEPEVLHRWRGGRVAASDRVRQDDGDDDRDDDDLDDGLDDGGVGSAEHDDDRSDRWARLGRLTPAGDRPSSTSIPPRHGDAPAVSALAAELEGLLGERNVPLPAPTVTPLHDRPPFPDPLVTAAIEEAIATLAVEW